MADILNQPKLNRALVPLIAQVESNHIEYDHKTEKPILIQTFDRRKFAELIIRECLEWCNAHAADDGTAQKIAASIKDHFGVK